jgi:signal transduction histidine kinase/ligand-binding sensor domain-containing protein
MKLCVSTLLLSLLLLLPGSLLRAQLPGQPRFDHLSTRDGLTSSAVSRILQDSQGFIWIATQAGLNRYDGYSFTHYENNPFDRNSLSHNLVQTMYLDRDDLLWLGTYGGLNSFDPKSGNFESWSHDGADPGSLSNNVVVAITRDSRGNLWVGTLDGLNRLDEESGSFVRYLPVENDPGSLPDKVVRSLLTDSRGTLWVGTYGGLSRYIPEEDRFETFAPEDDNPHALPSPFVMTILQDPLEEKHLWAGTWGGGVSLFDTETGQTKTYKLPADQVYDLLYDRLGRLWVATWGGGIVVLDPETGTSTHIRREDSSVAGKGLSHNVAYSLMEDDSGIIWIGTNGGGINKYMEWENRYRFVVNEPDNRESLSAGRITSVLENPDGTVWVGVYAGGLNLFDPESRKVTRFVHDPGDPSSLSNNIVSKIFRDSRGSIWIGTNGGLNRYRPESASFERFTADGSETALPEDVIYEISEDNEGRLWIGTNTAGAAVRDSASGRWHRYFHVPRQTDSLSDNLVRTILQDRRGSYWFGTNKGLNRLDTLDGAFRHYLHDPEDPEGLSNDNIRTILEDSEGTVWIATTGGGINRYNRESDTFTTISRQDGLLSNHILAMKEGEPGELWISTNRGMSIYTIGKGSFRDIDESNGLLSNELSSGLEIGSGNTLYIGSVNGLTIIDRTPEESAPYIPPIVLTSFEVMGEPYKLDRKHDDSYKELLLDHRQQLFSVQFAALDYSSPGRNQYSYMLEGFDTDWTYSGSRNYLRYTNLNPGRYTLHITGAGSRGNWNDDGLSIPITIAPPWWLSPFAYGLWLILFLLLALLLFRTVQQRRRRAEERYARQEEINRELDRKVRERTLEIDKARKLAEDATKTKSLFLANMSHEIRTPLTGILGMFSLLGKSPLDQDQRSLLDHSRLAAETLNQLVNDLLDFESIESGTMKLYPVPFSLNEVASYLEKLFAPRAKEQGLNFKVVLETGAALTLLGDRNRFIQILANLLSNAIKYTEIGSVSLCLTATLADMGTSSLPSYHVVSEVRDTGVGIPEKKLEAIFESFTQLDTGYSKTSKGAGLGLAIVRKLVSAMDGEINVQSNPGTGSIFTVSFALPGDTSSSVALEDPAAQPESSAIKGKGHILVCEDEGINRLYIGNFLKQHGYSIDLVSNGLEAVEAFKVSSYSLILMDLGMPEMDGREATKAIRRSESGPERTPIIALTAHTYKGDIEACYQAGMNDFIAKPVQEPELLRKIARWLS